MRSTHSPILKTAHLAQNINSDSPTRAGGGGAPPPPPPPPPKQKKKKKKNK